MPDKAFTRQSLEEIARRELEDLAARCQKQLQMKLSFGEAEVGALADRFTPDQGAYALKEGADPASSDWYQAALDKMENLHFSTPHIQRLFATRTPASAGWCP